MTTRKTRALVPALLPPERRYTSFRFSSDGKTLAGLIIEQGNLLNYLRLWDTGTGEEERISAGALGQGFCDVRLSPDGRILAPGAGGLGGRPTNPEGLWNLKTWKKQADLERSGKPLGGLAFSPDGKTLAGGLGNEVILWDPGTGKKLAALKGHTREWISFVDFSPDGRRLASAASEEGTIRVWNVADRKQTMILPPGAHQDPIFTGLGFGPDNTVLSTTHDGRLVRWTSARDRDLWQFPGVINRIALSADRRYLFTSNSNGTVYVIRLAPAAPVRKQEGQR